MADVQFRAILDPRPGRGCSIVLPFDPNETWGRKDRHHVSGSVDGHGLRGVVRSIGDAHVIQLGPAWCRGLLVARASVSR